MESSNFLRIEIPFISKGLFNTKGYKYRGTAHYIIRKEDKRIVFETMRLDEDQIIYGAANYSDGYLSDSYISGRINKPLKDTRIEMFDSFDWNYKEKNICRSKPLTEYKGSISELNHLIFSSGVTIKTVVGYISGSNAGGGLKNPKADEIVAFWEEDLIEKMYVGNINETEKHWKIFSSISHISNKDKNNENFLTGFTWEELLLIEKVEIDFLFNNDYKIIPWGKTMFEEDYVDFKKGIASQNREFFIDQFKDSDVLMFDEKYQNGDVIERIKYHIENGNWKGLKNELRAIWVREVNDDIDSNSFKGDFIWDNKRYTKCHIIENKEGKKLLDESISWEERINFALDLLDKNNYLLLDPKLHFNWDQAKTVTIHSDGYIENKFMPSKEFNALVGNEPNIFKKYPNANNRHRSVFLKYREKY